MELSPCLGIDLGTTNSLISIFRNGRTELIPNAFGHVLTPSAISMSEDGTIIVGLPARERMSTDPECTEVAFKRWMGSERRVRLGSQEFAPEELSALVLKSLKNDAESWLKTPVTRAVITVPAYFNETQRRATKVAAEIAGLQVERLLNEPTAAGLAYGLQEREEHSTFLVFDLGGGTFDVSVLEYFDGIVEVRASAGDTRLGGEDFVQVIENLFLAEYPKLKEKLEKNVAGSKMLWRAAEQAKRDLSDAQNTMMSIVIEGGKMECSVTREAFESASEELISRLRRPIERALRDARLDPEELAEVVLVGGATRMPLVRQTVARLFQRLPLRTIDPDETVVRGAAIQAALIDRNAALNEVVLTDVMPYSLGIENTERVNGHLYLDRFSPIIERNLPVPISRVASYTTVNDNQKVIIVYVRQGESPRASENLLLGELQIKVPPRPAGEARIDVRFSYDINGLLVVDVHEILGNTRSSALIRQNESGLSDAEITAAVQRLEMIKVHPRDQQENAYLVARAKRLYEDLLGDRREYIQYLLTHFESALDTQDEQKVRRARDSFRQELDDIGNGDFVL